MEIKTIVLSFSAILISVFHYGRQEAAPAKQPADAILGVWLTQEKDGKVEIYRSGDKFFGKLMWGKNLYEKDGKTLKKDIKNPEPSQRERTLLNLVMLRDFMYKEGEWKDGRIYDPRSGKTYSSTMKLKDGNLEVRGYIGLPAFGKSTVWTRP